MVTKTDGRVKETMMQETAERLKDHYQSQLEIFVNYCHMGFGCYEKLAQINVTTSRNLLTQANESLKRGDVSGFVATSGEIMSAHWTASLDCAGEFQRQVLVDLAKK